MPSLRVPKITDCTNKDRTVAELQERQAYCKLCNAALPVAYTLQSPSIWRLPRDLLSGVTRLQWTRVPTRIDNTTTPHYSLHWANEKLNFLTD